MNYPEKYRKEGDKGLEGSFEIYHLGKFLFCIASTGMGWEHVSVSSKRIPLWSDMEFIKNIFWNKEEYVIQYHVPESRHINLATTCLHMWRPIGIEFPVPPDILVGF